MNPLWRDHFPAFALPADAEQQQALLHGSFVSVLDDTGLIEVSGADAAPFLHSQLTHDIEHLGAAAARRAGYCTPKGRLLATFLLWRHGESIWLATSADVQATVQKRLSMFVLRAKAKLTDATGSHAMLALGGPAAGAVLGTWFDALPQAPLEKRDSRDGAHGVLVRLPDAASQVRYLWALPLSAVPAVWPALAGPLTPVAAEAARWLDIQAGVPRIVAATQEQFVPQMINWEVVDGVSFRKGCYPGQEIVARSQFRGTIKRRLQLAHSDAPLAPGAELFAADAPDQPCGMLVNAAPSPRGGWDCLVEIKLAVREQAPAPAVHAGAIDGPVLRFAELPYTLFDPTEDAQARAS